MNAALLQPGLRVVPMSAAMVDAVAAVEASAYSFPWTRGNFLDSIAAGYLAEAMLEADGRVVAYMIAMQGVDEMHLLNITVAPARWGQGLALKLLDRLVGHARALRAHSVWLEVREANTRARRIYERYGFEQVGVRRGYYPAPHGAREDAVVMSLVVPAEEAGHGLE